MKTDSFVYAEAAKLHKWMEDNAGMEGDSSLDEV